MEIAKHRFPAEFDDAVSGPGAGERLERMTSCMTVVSVTNTEELFDT